MKVAIVGSRRRSSYKDRSYVYRLVDQLGHEAHLEGDGYPLEFVSGACPLGADAFIAEVCKVLGLSIKEFPVDHSTPITSAWEFAKRAYARNRQIAEYADVVYALVHSDRTGGTENTIEHARTLKKPVYIVDDVGRIYLEGEDSSDKAGAP
jgi:hypothetical protein